MGPLEGLKVVEVAGLGPAPVAGMMLADMGADVVVIERPRPGVPPSHLGAERAASFFLRGKRSVVLDLKQPCAVAAALCLFEQADVVIEGFRPGVMERLGLGPADVLQRNPRLVYGRLTGWGQTGPLAQAAGHDPNYTALSGALWHGHPSAPPAAPLTLAGDVGGGTLMLLFGVLSAVFHAGRTGKGQVVDAAIADGAASLSSLLWVLRGAGQLGPERGEGWADYGAPWNGTYACADGRFVTVCALEPQFHAELLQRMGLADDPRVSEQWNREGWAEGRRAMADRFAEQSQAAWCSRLEGTDACFAPVLSLDDAPDHPHNQSRGTFSVVRGVTQPSPAPKLSGTPGRIGALPGLGEHTEAALREAGVEEAVLTQLLQT